MEELPWDWKPKHVSPEAAKLLDKPWYDRLKEVLYPKEETFRQYLHAFISSFTVEELEHAIETNFDAVEGVIRFAKIDNPFVRPAAKFVIMRNEYQLYYWLVGWPGYIDTGPGGFVRSIYNSDPTKYAMLTTPEGWRWFQQICYELALFFKQFGGFSTWNLSPPPGYHARLPTRAHASPIV